MKTVTVKLNEIIKDSCNITVVDPVVKIAPNEEVLDMILNPHSNTYEFPGFHTATPRENLNIIRGII